ncbi:MAG: hypothetical protein KBT69_13635 [Oceanihabitans sp.]|nr:hypothetical protein [Oceanihabitans sp.]
MKTKITLVLAVLCIALTSFTTLNQDRITVDGQYDGSDGYGYNFIVFNDDDEETTLTLHEVEEDVLDEYNLDTEDVIGSHFQITYIAVTETVLDENGDEQDEEKRTIVALKPIN